MAIGIIGAGSMGCIFTHFFIKSGYEVKIYEKNSETCNAIKNGLLVTVENKEYTYHPQIETDPAVLNTCSSIFIFTKSYSTGEVAEIISKLENKDAIIVSLQNGLGNFDKLKEHIDTDRIVYGTTSIGAAKTSHSEVKFGGQGIVIAGGKSRKRTSDIIEILKKCGINAQSTEDPDGALWQKAIINAGINPIAAILHIPNGKIIENSYSLELQDKIVSEAVLIAQEMGIDLMRHEMLLLTRDICQKTATNICSMLQDLRNKRKTEIDSINGLIIEYGRMKSIPTPFNDAVYMLVKAEEEYHEKS